MVMKWLTAMFVLLLLALAAIPVAIEAASGWLVPRRASVQSIDYLGRDIHDLSASRRRTPRKWDHGLNDLRMDGPRVDE
jgi:hypothetical protein